MSLRFVSEVLTLVPEINIYMSLEINGITSKMQHNGENDCVNEMCIQKVRFWMWEDMLEVTLRPLSS